MASALSLQSSHAPAAQSPTISSGRATDSSAVHVNPAVMVIVATLPSAAAACSSEKVAAVVARARPSRAAHVAAAMAPAARAAPRHGAPRRAPRRAMQ